MQTKKPLKDKNESEYKFIVVSLNVNKFRNKKITHPKQM